MSVKRWQHVTWRALDVLELQGRERLDALTRAVGEQLSTEAASLPNRTACSLQIAGAVPGTVLTAGTLSGMRRSELAATLPECPKCAAEWTAALLRGHWSNV